MNAKLSTRLIFRVGVPAVLLFALVMSISAFRNFQRDALDTVRANAARFDVRLSRARKIPQMIADHLGTGTVTQEGELEKSLRALVAGNPEIYGSCIAFEPSSFGKKEYYYAPYWYRKNGELKFEQLGNAKYNYFDWDWYRRPKEADRALWSEPYYDAGGGETIMTTYSVPFRRDGHFWGIATIDIAMDELADEASAIRVAKTGYAFIVSTSGRFLAFPDKSKIWHVSLQDVNPRLAKLLLPRADGLARSTEPLDGRTAWIAYAPVQEGDFSLALVYPQSELFTEALKNQKEHLALAAIGLIAIFGASVFTARSLSKPITELAVAAQKIAQGELDHRLQLDAPTEEVRRLNYAFNKMAQDLKTRMQELRDSTTVTERMEGELNAARSIQMSLLPKRFPAFPERTEIDIHAVVRPAREVGGDLYDFYFLDDDWLCFLIGDVSGKGIPAALFMAVTKTLLKASSSRLGPLDRMFAKVNNELCEQTDTAMFVSLVCGRLHVPSGKLEICNAGHPAPFLVSRSGEVSPLDGAHSVALGADPEIEYTVTRTRLAEGDALFFYTDGVTEALTEGENFYSVARLQNLLREVAKLPVETMTRRVVQDVQDFSGGRPQSDDISVLAVRWFGAVGVATLPNPEI